MTLGVIKKGCRGRVVHHLCILCALKGLRERSQLLLSQGDSGLGFFTYFFATLILQLNSGRSVFHRYRLPRLNHKLVTIHYRVRMFTCLGASVGCKATIAFKINDANKKILKRPKMNILSSCSKTLNFLTTLQRLKEQRK